MNYKYLVVYEHIDVLIVGSEFATYTEAKDYLEIYNDLNSKIGMIYKREV